MLYPSVRVRIPCASASVLVDIKVQVLRLGPSLSNCKGQADDTWPTLTCR